MREDSKQKPIDYFDPKAETSAPFSQEIIDAERLLSIAIESMQETAIARNADTVPTGWARG